MIGIRGDLPLSAHTHLQLSWALRARGAAAAGAKCACSSGMVAVRLRGPQCAKRCSGA